MDEILLDPGELAALKAHRRRRFNILEVPLLRLLGFVLLALMVGVHNLVVLGTLPAWRSSLIFGTISVAYSILSWLVLYRFYRPRRHFDLGDLFLLVDPLLYLLAIYVTGGEKSFLFFLLIARVADQANTTFRRTTFLSHYVVVVYLALLAYLSLVEHRAISWPLETLKVVSVYLFNLYLSVTSRTAQRLRQRTREAIGRAREELLGRLRLEQELVDRNQTLETVNHELNAALTEIKVLRGIVPICSFCKNIRDEAGQWKQLESYIRDHSEAEFSHGICPSCEERYYRGVR